MIDIAYKIRVGDCVKIKSWDSLVQEYGLNPCGGIVDPRAFIEINKDRSIGSDYWPASMTQRKEEFLKKNFPDRILRVKETETGEYHEDGFYIAKIGYYSEKIDYRYVWGYEMIEKIIKNYKEPKRIDSRFEILDL